ncbi:MAG: linear amide C-N hydrolase [Bacteroidia bacterium]|nr:linear amide C-N hydrolase [Bacteroidia bacterium]
MMLRKNKLFRFGLYVFLGIGILFVGLAGYLAIVAIDHPPKISDTSVLQTERVKLDTNCFVIGNNWIRKNQQGVWEMYVEGSAFERGVITGKLSKELIYIQEKAFTDQIIKMVPSEFYRHFLKYFIAWFNRDLDEHVSKEFREEVYGVSLAASPEFDYIGSAFQRMMNYHAAHDIGHALQNMALVGCSSFATWDEKSKDSTLIVARNFDFYVGDQFAENKIVYFCKPDSGNKFMMVTWGGLIGVVSGMNYEGLSITLNAAKSDMPAGSATPVSLLAREVLQYATTIDQAVEVLQKRKTFVSESFMIGSAKDGRAVIVEKTPEKMDVFEEKGSSIVCTNHYQSPDLFHQQQNLVQMSQSASVYREERIRELLGRVDRNTPSISASILRDQGGLKDKFIGYGNEKAVNQLIAHHAIVFEPEKKLVWVSASPWQLGEFIAYDLNKIFGMEGLNQNIAIDEGQYKIAADSFLQTKEYLNFLEFRKLKSRILEGSQVDIPKLLNSNPEYYLSYVLAGDQEFRNKNYDLALGYYMSALTKEIATKTEEHYIKAQIIKCEKKEL